MNIKVIPVSEVRKKGVENVVRQTLQHLSACDDIYVSFDVDSMDSAISRGTGTPVSNGLKEREAEDLLAALVQNRKNLLPGSNGGQSDIGQGKSDGRDYV